MSTESKEPVTYGRDASEPRWTLARYQKMIEAGILTPEDKVELLENYVVLRLPRSPRHGCTIQLMFRPLLRSLPAEWMVRVLGTVVLSDSQPEPDFSIVRGTPRTFLTRHPGAADVGLIIEVAESSLLRDQRDKARIYARGGIPCYWIVNLVDRRIEVYGQPSGPTPVPAYGSLQTYQPGDTVPLVLDGATVAAVPAADLLP
jgi:Uma2 family endonuclease